MNLLRKLTLVFLVLTVALGATHAQKKEMLFNGKDLSNWEFIVDEDKVPADQVYSVKDGTIHIAGMPFGYMYTKKKYRNFHLHVEWKWPKGESNSGIFLLIEETKNPFPNGIECQLHAGDAGDFVLLGGSDMLQFEAPKNEPRPAFPVVKKWNKSSEKEAGEWNEANIFVKEGVITVYINGVLQNMGNNPNKEGHIGLQSEGKDVQFRNIYVTTDK